MADSADSGFYIAPFGIDGEQVGLGFWNASTLSDIWLGVCKEFLNVHGAVFDAPWSGKLFEIRTKFTSASGAAIATFFVRDRVASSLLFLSGHSPEVERTVTEMFIESLRKAVWVQTAALSLHPFLAIASIGERPLMVAVAWPEPTMSEQDNNIVRELGLHLAGAFLTESSICKTI
mgnify:FL=1